MRKTKISLVVAALLGSTIAVNSAVAETGGYQVTDIGAVPGAIHTSPRAINDSGQVVGQLADLRDQNIRLDLLDPEVFENIENFDDLTDGEYRQVRNYLINSVGGNPKFQHLANELGFFYGSSGITELDGFDTLDNETGLRTDSVSFRVLDMNNQGITVGQSAPAFQWIEAEDNIGEPSRFHVRSTFPQGAWTDGTNYRLVTGEPGLVMNGTASLFAINDNNVAVGIAAVENGANLQDAFDNQCTTDEEVDEDGQPIYKEPVEACLHRYWFARSGIPGAATPLAVEEAYRWSFDNQGNVLEQGRLGLAFDKEADAEDVFNTLRYRSVANDINNNGVIIGVSQRQVEGGTFSRATQFTEEGAINILQDLSGQNSSVAVAINDNNVAVGFSNLLIDGSTRQRMFYMDLTNGPSEPTYPTGFFADSDWQPRSINNQGQIVGVAQIDASNFGQRRSAGFMYDIASDTVVNLNAYLGCDSGYTILDAIDINNSGEIAALAIRVSELDEDGQPTEAARLRTLVLSPDGSETGCPEVEEVQQERKGASTHPLWLGFLGLIAIISLRRRKALK
ncbi:hypothetical protein CWE08_04215 [Aliidiomarina iranensis]|uniref:DUF3466 family protein n=1 Tax=Aliidiomarina iranensis TaxID=1434071 RepID=A0A432W081_9GAMM|nr:DUF3466 family protein [Aliidiomarina iranensis]RUO22393.1 hypothetical protein CWE08_04215 [Aliidiomarina iranensis]